MTWATGGRRIAKLESVNPKQSSRTVAGTIKLLFIFTFIYLFMVLEKVNCRP